MSKPRLRDRIKSLEATIHPKVKEADPPESIMSSLIWSEWAHDWRDTGIERVEEAVADVIRRLKDCPLTAEYGGLLEGCKDVIVDEVRRRQSSSPPSDVVEYKEA